MRGIEKVYDPIVIKATILKSFLYKPLEWQLDQWDNGQKIAGIPSYEWGVSIEETDYSKLEDMSELVKDIQSRATCDVLADTPLVFSSKTKPDIVTKGDINLLLCTAIDYGVELDYLFEGAIVELAAHPVLLNQIKNSGAKSKIKFRLIALQIDFKILEEKLKQLKRDKIDGTGRYAEPEATKLKILPTRSFSQMIQRIKDR